MHESIATAIYKGHKRTLDERLHRYVQRLPAGGAPRKRKPWLRVMRSAFFNLPSQVWFGECASGSGKDATVELFGVALCEEREGSDRKLWLGTAVRISARHYSVESRALPVRITHHAITRAMQRLALPDVHVAASRLGPAFFTALTVERDPPRDGSSILLPAIGGAVVAAADRDEPEDWVFLTYIDEGKLRPEQVTEAVARAKAWGDLFNERGVKAELVASS